MSSATSIDGDVPPKPDAATAPASAPPSIRPVADVGFRSWHFFVLASLIAATAAVLLSRQSTPEHLILLSLTIVAAGATAAGFYRMLAPLVGEGVSVTSESLSARSRAALEREKMLVLRSIKELEFDHAMGKVSPTDFDEMAGRLRARALSLMKQLDQDGAEFRATIENELSVRLARRSSERIAVRPDADGSATPRKPEAAMCATCGTRNDPDALFCKRCGIKL